MKQPRSLLYSSPPQKVSEFAESPIASKKEKSWWRNPIEREG